MLVLHGGTSVSTRPTSPAQLAVLRMIPVAAAVGAALRGSAAVVRRHRFAMRGWNSPAASPAADLRRVLDELAGAAGPPSVILIGHSMGARAALRVADHPLVTAVGGLAPWIPPDDPAVPLPGLADPAGPRQRGPGHQPGGHLGVRAAGREVGGGHGHRAARR